MKNIFFLLIFALVFFYITSCEKEDVTNDIRFRLVKIADNQQMEDAAAFEYNSEGMVNKIIDGYGQYFTGIEYNSNGLPIQVWESSVSNPLVKSNISIIEWTMDGFTITDPDNQNSKDVFTLNDQNQILSRVHFHKYDEVSFDTSYVEMFSWINSKKLKITDTRTDYWSGEVSISEKIYEFENVLSPFNEFNIALFIAIPVEWAEWQEYQSLYIPTKYTDEYFSANISYEINKYKLPEKAIISYNSAEGSFTENMYFEYEPF